MPFYTLDTSDGRLHWSAPVGESSGTVYVSRSFIYIIVPKRIAFSRAMLMELPAGLLVRQQLKWR
jgi:hypothetical protein